MSRIWTIARREVKSMFDQPTGYVVLVVFLGINAFMFFRTAFLTNVASLRPMFDFLPWIFLFFVPAVSMRSVAEDNRGGMLEILLSQPISEAELIAGKYLGVLVILLGALATTLLIPIGLMLGSHFPWGTAIAQYLGGALLAAGFAGVGVWASSLSKSQIIAFLLAVVVMFLLILVGLDPILVGLPAGIGTVAARLGVLTHFESIGRGLIDVRDVLYFLSLAAIFLVLAYAELMRRRLAVQGEPRKRLRYGALLLIAMLIVLNLAGSEIGGRVDLSPGHAYTLSPATKEIVRSVDDIVTIKLFASKELPAEFALTRRDVTDLLRDFRSAGNGKVRVIERDPDADPAVAKEAQGWGVGPVQFNVVGKSEMQVKQGYFGIVVQKGERHETMPFVQRTEDLEYRLVSAIRSMARTSKPKIGLSFDPRIGGTVNLLRTELEKQYSVESPVLSDSTPLSPDLQALVIASADDALPHAAVEKVGAFLAQGGRVFLMESGMAPQVQSPYATARPVGYNPAIAPFGVAINSDIVYDLKAHEMVPVGRAVQPYPYFSKAQSTYSSPVNAEVAELGVLWGSSIDVSKAKPGTVTPLFVTTKSAGVQIGQAVIDPMGGPTYPTTNLGVRVMAAQVVSNDSKARLIVVGNSRILLDPAVQRDQGNLAFALNGVDWLTADDALIGIRSKDRRPPPLVFTNDSLKQLVKYVNVAGLPLLIAFIGLTRLIRRRRLANAPYQRTVEVPA